MVTTSESPVPRRSVSSSQILRWTARIWSLLLLVFWRSFLVEHLSEWFLGAVRWPPLNVWLLTFAHLMFLLGLLAGWRWELSGGVVSITAATVFFSLVARRLDLPFFLATAIGPGCLWLLLGIRDFSRRDLSRSRGSDEQIPEKRGVSG